MRSRRGAIAVVVIACWWVSMRGGCCKRQRTNCLIYANGAQVDVGRAGEHKHKTKIVRGHHPRRVCLVAVASDSPLRRARGVAAGSISKRREAGVCQSVCARARVCVCVLRDGGRDTKGRSLTSACALTVLSCLAQLLDWANRLPQVLHLKGFSPVCCGAE